jgi:transcriptional regulator with XRE-family HTH domain
MQTSLGKRLRLLRAERGLTLRSAADLCGVTKETLSALERGVREPHDPTLAKIAKGYGVPVAELLEEPALAGKAEAPLSPEQALSIPDDDDFRRTIKGASTEELRGLVVQLVSGYKPLTLEDVRRGRHEKAFQREAYRRVKAFSRAVIIDEELERRGEESPEIYPLALKRFLDATTQPEEASARNHDHRDQETA